MPTTMQYEYGDEFRLERLFHVEWDADYWKDKYGEDFDATHSATVYELMTIEFLETGKSEGTMYFGHNWTSQPEPHTELMVVFDIEENFALMAVITWKVALP